MSLIDWCITIIPTVFIIGLGIYVKKYVIGVSDFMVAGRVCRRYVLTTSNMANALGLVTLIAYVEIQYKTGFALDFWRNLLLPVSVIISLSGYCLYRFRETKVMSLGQFLELRYNRSLRIFSCFLRSLAEMMANMIMPALAARFFIYYLDLPQKFNFFGIEISTFLLIVIITLTVAISLIFTAGTLSIIITDTMQGLLFFPVIVVFIIFILTKFSWGGEIVPVMLDRAADESFLNPYDVEKLSDFNLFWLFVIFVGMIMHPASHYIGSSNAAISAHESKMASILGAWRGAFTTVFFVIIGVSVITVMNHINYNKDAKDVRVYVSQKIAEELIPDEKTRDNFMQEIKNIPVAEHRIGVDEPYSQTNNPDEVYFQTAQAQFGLDGVGSANTQQFKTLFRQMMLPVAIKQMMPTGLIGLFCMMILLFIISTDDSRIYSASSTLVQDCIVPFYKSGTLSPQKHIFYIRLLSIGVGVFFLIGSYFMAQLDYINLFIQIMYGMWLGGCGPMLIFGFYSKFGTSAGAWSSLLAGMSINLSGALIQRNWAETIYPWLEKIGYVDKVGVFLQTVSRPFNPYINWEMNRLKFPINSYEIYFMAMMVSIIVYCAVSYLTCKEPFNLDRMLHRGKYAIDGEVKIKTKWTLRNIFSKIIGITPEYSKADKVIAYSVFGYSFIYKFLIAFALVAIWNFFSPWKVEWWGKYFFMVSIIIPGIAAFFTAIWFGIGSVKDLRLMFKDLQGRVANPDDNGMVEGHISVADKASMEKIDKINK